MSFSGFVDGLKCLQKIDIFSAATGPELVKVAFENNLPIFKIIENADFLIVMHNDRKQSK